MVKLISASYYPYICITTYISVKRLFFILYMLHTVAHAQIIITSAGTGAGGFGGDGGSATVATLYNPYGVTLDKDGNLYICDNGNRRVRKVSPAYGGIITTVAGNGTAGFSGDGSDASYAQIDGAWDIAVDKKGNVFIADGGNERIRKIAPSGIISTFAGTGIAGYNGDGIPATSAQLNSPIGICVDDTCNVYIADAYNHRIRKIDTFGTISTIAGNGISGFTADGSRADTAALGNVYAVRVNNVGKIYFADNYRLRKINEAGKIITIAGNGISGSTGDGGDALAASVDISAFCIDTVDNIFIAEGNANKIRKISSLGVINSFAGTGIGGYYGDLGIPENARLNLCQGVAISPYGDVYIGDVANNRIRMISAHLTKVISPPDVEKSLSILPNPATDAIIITLTDEISTEHEAGIFTVDGRLLFSFCLQSNLPTHIDAIWPSGTYIINISTTHGTISEIFSKY